MSEEVVWKLVLRGVAKQMTFAKDLRKMGFSDEQIAAAEVDGKPLAEVDKKKPSRVEGMNKTEAQYSYELDWRKQEGVVEEYWFERVKLKLAYKTFYTPDFLVRYTDGRLVFVEIKGFLRDDAAVKFKLAREMFPWAEFVMLRRVKGEWVEVNI